MTPTTPRFALLVSAASGSGALLPLTHTTDGYLFRQIISTKQLEVANCIVFGEPTLYFFYGRPAYRMSSAGKSTILDAFSLVCFVLSPELLPSPKRLFPFDTGAMHRGLFSEHLHPRMTIASFEVYPDIREARKIVEIFYGNNFNYYMGKALSGKSFPVLEMEAQCYYSLLQHTALDETDDRKGSVEVQFTQNIPLTHENVMAVVMPEPFWDDNEIAEFVYNELMAEALSYDCYNAQPLEDTRAIMREVRSFLESKGLLR
jgi:hypothetical protein